MRGFIWFLSGVVGISLMASGVLAQSRQVVELELVLALDTSTSVNDREFELQWRGLSQAFRDPQVLRAIDNLGPLGMAVTLVQWAGLGQQSTSIDWVHITDAASANAFATQITRAPRLMQGFTDIGGAIRFSTNAIATNAYDGLRKTIDVSGDGTSSTGSPAPQRDQALAQDISINGLVIFNEEYDLGILASIDLEDHFRNNVIGGPGAFLIRADDFDDFARAIHKKLLREIHGPLFSQNTSRQQASTN